jgi:uroporphyrinogen decarboxylase
MNHKERVLKALFHQDTDRVPFMYRDIPEVRERLKKELALNSDEQLFEFFDIDFRWVEPSYVGSSIIKKENYKKDIWGVEWEYTYFNKNDGYWNVKKHPLIDIYQPEALDEYPWPNVKEWDFSSVDSICNKYSEYAIMTAPGIASPGIFQTPVQELIGVERSFIEFYTNPFFFSKLIEKILEFHLSFIDTFFASANGKIDFFRIGDDFGTQQGLLLSIDIWEQLFLPAFKQMSDTAKKYGAHYYQHSCGAVRDLIPSFVKAGVEVLDPLQVTAKHMDPLLLKKEFGDLICFSGGVDEQYLLPFEPPEKIKKETKKLIDIMSKNGGFFLGPTHNFQTDIPTENIIAMYEAAK